MSNYTLTVKHKKTGELHNICAIDNYFGQHNYGYRFFSGLHCDLVLNVDELAKNYERVER